MHALPELGCTVAPIVDTAALAQRYLDEHDLRGVPLVGHFRLLSDLQVLDAIVAAIDNEP